jgi:hypothetical protein
MARPEFTNARWRKSTMCADGESCVEVGKVAEGICVRKSGDGDSGPILLVEEYDWRTFVLGARAGEFDSMQ